MGTTADNNLRLDVPDNTLDDNTWGTILNDLIQEFERTITSIHSQAFTSSDVTILADGSNDEAARKAILVATGALAGNVNFIVPNEPKIYIVSNETTESFTVGVKTSGGTRIDIPQGEVLLIYCDGSDTFLQLFAKPSGTIAQATNADQLGNIVAANYAQKAVKNQWTKPQIMDASLVTLTLANPKTYEPNADNDTTVYVTQAEMDRDTNPLKFLNPIGTPIDGQSLIFVVEQSNTAALALTWDTLFLFPDDTAVDLTQTIDKVDTFAFLYSGTLAAWLNFGTALNIPRS